MCFVAARLMASKKSRFVLEKVPYFFQEKSRPLTQFVLLSFLVCQKKTTANFSSVFSFEVQSVRGKRKTYSKCKNRLDNKGEPLTPKRNSLNFPHIESIFFLIP